MNIHDLKSKDTGHNLIEHSNLVSRFAVEIAKKTLKNKNEVLLEAVRVAGLVHDIGKSCKHFQDKLESIGNNKKIFFRHNEIGWAFLHHNLKLKTDVQKLVLDTVYWHHGISNNMNAHISCDILSYHKEDIDTMKDFLHYFKLKLNEGEKDPKRTPIYYPDEDDDFEKMFVRFCVISADRIVSSIPEIELENINIQKRIDQYINRKNGFKITKNPYKGSERFDSQESIVFLTTNQCTNIVKAPAGFGKTMVGVLKIIKGQKRVIWVCPRNIIAQSVYNSILNELGVLGINASVELYLSGKVEKSTTGNKNGFESDIIVTNIDNYLAPAINNSHMDKLFLINSCDVVFDEYHEFVSEDGLFAAFMNIMKCRHRLTNSKTLMLSATPIDLDKWFAIGNYTTILPSTGRHYSAAHQKKYKLNVKELKDIDNFKVQENTSSLIIANTISGSQIVKTKLGIDILVHSGYEKLKREHVFEYMINNYGKDSLRSRTKKNVVSTHILQASIEVSFNNLYEFVLSPEATMQRIGRIDRWGDYEGISTINIFKLNDKRESMIKDVLYDKKLSDEWFKFLQQYDGKMITLDELYNIYNNFSANYATEIKRFVNKRLTKSQDHIKKIYPIKYNDTKHKSEVLKAGSNKLRSNGNEIFFIAKKYNSEEYSEPFPASVIDFEVELKEDSDTLNKMIRTMKNIVTSGDERFNYQEIITKEKRYSNKSNLLKDIRKYAKWNNTPYIRFDVVYHEELGIISHKLLNELKGS